MYRPSAMPDRIVLCWNDDPRTTQTVNWRTSQEVSKGIATVSASPIGWLNAMIPSVAVPGNHEQAKANDGQRRLSHHWRPSFTFHHPIFSTGKDRDNPELRELWKPLFDKYKVVIVLQGHDHTYGRMGFTVPDTIASVPTGVQAFEEQHGTIYVVSVSGPKMYNNNRLPFMKRLAEDTQLYQLIHIDGSSLRFEARTAIGELYDAFELKKQPGQTNQLIEREPEVSENLREPADEKS